MFEDSTYAKTRNTQGAINYSAIVKAIEENVHKRMSVSQLSKVLNMSEINLQKTFSKYAGVGVIEYFTRVQITKATEYLKEGNFVRINEWLKEHVHKYGRSVKNLEVVKLATNEEFTPKYYVNYLKNKFIKLYEL